MTGILTLTIMTIGMARDTIMSDIIPLIIAVIQAVMITTANGLIFITAIVIMRIGISHSVYWNLRTTLAVSLFRGE